MTQRNIANVVGDMENFIDSLLSHAEEDNCTHSITDLIEEFFDNRNKKGVGRPGKASNTRIAVDAVANRPNGINKGDLTSG